jgi:hypothetical protein
VLLDQARSWDDHGNDTRGDLGVRSGCKDDLCRRAQVLDTSVGARTDEYLIDGDVFHPRIWGKAHVLEGTLYRALLGGVGDVGRVGNDASDGHDILRRGTPGDGGDDVVSADVDLDVELGTLVRLQGPPVSLGFVPEFALGSQGSALDVVEGDFVRSDHARTSTCFDAHVAHTHPGLHTESTDDGTSELDHRSSSSGCADDTDDMEHDVLRYDAFGEGTADVDSHVFALRLQESLGGEDVLDLGGSYAKSQGAESTVCCDLDQDRRVSMTKPYLLDVCESPQTQVIPGRVNPCSGPIMWTIPVEGV